MNLRGIPLKSQSDASFDVIGIGLGPFNLSVAALLEPVHQLKARFFEREKEFQWHPGLLFPESTIQNSFLKDLVTLADPTSPQSFLSFLFASRRLYRFINANFARVSRVEFNQYFRWVANRLSTLQFGHSVEAISWKEDSFVIHLQHGEARARNIILGTGLHPVVPPCAAPYVGEGPDSTVLHASRFMHGEPMTKDRRVVVVGGGQTGAEVVHHLIGTAKHVPRKLVWISKRSNFLPLDESPFTNELFTPNYSDYFYGLSSKDRLSILVEQKLASDGINDWLLERIYQLLYEAEFLNGQGRSYALYPRCELVDMKRSSSGGWELSLHDDLACSLASVEADVVILATGFAYRMLPALEPIKPRLHFGENGFVVGDDYSIEWDGPDTSRIYIQNGARQYRGIADPNLSLMAWRSARIINSLAGRAIYDIAENNSVFDFAMTDSSETTEPVERTQSNDYQSAERFSQIERDMFAVRCGRRVVGT
jgi:lysine N6-hydroxylase